MLIRVAGHIVTSKKSYGEIVESSGAFLARVDQTNMSQELGG